MPIYEYQCGSCKTVFQLLVMRKEDDEGMKCPTCGEPEPGRVLSRVAFHVSERARLDAYDPGSTRGESFYRDPRNIGLDAKKKAQQMGVDLGQGFEEKLDKLRTDPGSVLKE